MRSVTMILSIVGGFTARAYSLPMNLLVGLHLSTAEGSSEWPNLKAAVIKAAVIDGSTLGS